VTAAILKTSAWCGENIHNNFIDFHRQVRL
jgi:hypothetical protein